jgi:hypothetical protein
LKGQGIYAYVTLKAGEAPSDLLRRELVAWVRKEIGGCGTNSDVSIGEDPVASLAEHYRRESLDARLPVTLLLRKLGEMLGSVAAVVISLPSDDASFGWDYPRVRELLAARTIPHIVLGGDPANGATAADLERIRALLGSARPRREAGHG